MKHPCPPLTSWFHFAVTLVIFSISLQSYKTYGYTVSNITATYSHGQVFLTWKNPNAMNLQYNVYRSNSKFTASSQLTSENFLGFVRDNSAKNIHLSMEQGSDIYFKIQDSGQPLSPDAGVYAVTCTDNQSWYYAITITDLSNDKESKKIIPGANSLATPVIETVEKPQPVLQDSLMVASGDMKRRYVQFGNNQETPLYPALNSTGSYGFNFYLVKRGNSTSYPLIVVYEGEGALASGGVGIDATFTDCYILGVDDWLPVPDGNGGIGDNAHYCCYHENFNIYSNANPVPTSGVVKTYPQRRYIEAIHWVEDHFPMEAGKIYLKGTSATGFGALLTAAIIPEEIAAAYAVVEPVSIGTNNESVPEQMWGLGASKLPTDIPDPNTMTALPFTKLSDLRKMIGINEKLELPLIFDVHGKKDNSVSWSEGKIEWYDSLEANHAGGVFYWDQREHNGADKKFLSEETMPAFFRYSTLKSYPAFSHCSINQDPGNGSPNNGDPYGAINGYLDWEDDITDEICDYTINVFVKDFYAGGVLDPEQYNTCTTDITFRRLQNFHPNNGATIKWKNYDATNTKIQHGSITCNGGFITLKGIKVNKSGNRIELKIPNCGKLSDEADDAKEEIYFSKSSDGYTAHVYMNEGEDIYIRVMDVMGRTVSARYEQLLNGLNTFEIPDTGNGIFIVTIKGSSFSHVEKLLF